MLQRVGANGPTPERRQTIYGVDFSGAVDAGARIWVARGSIQDNSLVIEESVPAEVLPDSSRDRSAALAAIRRLVESQPDAVFGFDFPFSLPAGLIHALFGSTTWEEMGLSFRDRFPIAESFRSASIDASGGHELRRATEREARTPFSPYNLRLHRQTYHGIVEILAPLVRARAADVLPMQTVEPGKAWLMEICPASTLKRIETYAPYKGNTPLHVATRKSMLMSMKKKGPLSFSDPSIEQRVLANQGGDALDSVVAAFAVFKNLRDPSFDILHPSADEAWKLEGWVYT